MTSRPSPITPSDELIQQWRHERIYSNPDLPSGLRYLAIRASRWGWDQRGAANEAELQKAADQELEACIEWLHCYVPRYYEWSANFRVARRPKPPSLKEQALEALNQADEGLNESAWQQRSDTIRRALEALPND